MFRIRRIYDDVLPADKEAIRQVQKIVRDQFPLLSDDTVVKLSEALRDPLKYRFRSILFVAAGAKGLVRGFALLQHAPDLEFCYLDFISAAKQTTGGGIGSVLYERVREEALALRARGLFFECLPDDVDLCRDPRVLKQNSDRLRFYERYGARPVVNTVYETPLKPEDDCPPFLVFDDLGRGRSLSRDRARRIVRAILERKYGDLCPEGYIDLVVRSFRDDPVRIREPKYTKPGKTIPVRPVRTMEKAIALVVNEKHHIHHVHERGYVESPVRVRSILREIEPTGLFEKVETRHFSERHIKAVHDSQFVEYLRRVCALIGPDESIYPYVFPIRNAARPPKELPIRAGYYCIDTFTPLNQNAYLAARSAVDCALTVAQKILEGFRLGYALVRPPGHHAEQRAFGGFCYFNSSAIVAHYLSGFGKVAVLDIDYHHGNGTQNIFYGRRDVLTVSIHGHPSFAYPYFSGFDDEKGEGEGFGQNLNIPLPENLAGDKYRGFLERAIRRIVRFRPNFLVVALGADTAKGDPTGSWALEPRDFRMNGGMIGSTRLPTIVVQEGGYRIRSLGINIRNFFVGLWEGHNARTYRRAMIG
jgi:acetoin utilization deacetylase AcuC-like enzyme/GNAT superfamily N-acetyltransferase